MKLVIYDCMNNLVHDENNPEYIPRKGEGVKLKGSIRDVERVLYDIDKKKIRVNLR